jgi:LuxR family transcriptional regulator, maltose regulon positive regulatory protein
MTALLESKYRVPTRRRFAVARPRLEERLKAAYRVPLTVLSAPAGFGKTTMLTEWLTSVADELPCVGWLSLDARDNDTTLFWTYLVTAMQTAVDDVGADALRLLTSPPFSVESALAALLNDLDALTSELILVLDDYHLIDAPEVHQGVAFLLEHQPAQLHLVVATRVDPPLPLARMRSRDQLLEVRAVDLRFTAEESAAYLNEAMGLGLTENDVNALERRTEGWIAALQLAALSMQGRADVGAFIAEFAGDDRYIVDYLVEEVLGRQSTDIRRFLLETSVLDRLTGSLCDAITGRDDGKATLVALERANLFLVPLDDKRQWYRYHHLFADVLRAHLAEERGREVADLHRRASTWFDANGDTPQAVRHSLAAGDVGAAADLMERALPVVQRERREVELARWVEALPDEVVRARPVLAIGLVGSLAQRSQFDSIPARLSDIEHALRAKDGTWSEQPPPEVIVVDEAAYRSVPARVEMYRAALALADADLDGTVAHAGEALSLTPSGDDLTRAAAGALAGLAYWTTGDLDAAHAAYTETVNGLTRAGFLADVLGCCISLGDIRRTQGRLGDAVRTYRWALELTAPQPGAPPLRGTADMHVGIAEVLLERDELEAASEHLALCDRLGEYNGLPQNPYRRRVMMARLREADGDLDGALALLNEADRVYAGDYNPNVRPVPAVRARLQIRRGELDSAIAWARERELSPDDTLSYPREYEHITLARLLLARHRSERDRTALDEGLALLERLLAAAEDGGRGGSVLELLILLALAHQARGDMPAALATLQRAVPLAHPEGYVRLFAQEGPPMAGLLKALPNQPPAPGYLRRLLAATAGRQDRPATSRVLIDPLSDRELDVLRLLGTDLDGPDIARELSVSLNTMRTHTKNIYAKLGVSSRRAAVSRAGELNLLPHQRRARA